jgi:hypothetical protein
LCRLRFLLLRFPAFTREPQAAWHRRLRGTLGKDSPNSPSRDTLGTQQMIERNRLTREPAGTKVLGERTQHRCTPDSLLLHRGSLTPETKLKLGSDRTSPLGRPGAAIEVPDRQQPRFPATFYGRTNRCIGVHFHPNRPYFRCAFSGISNLEAVPLHSPASESAAGHPSGTTWACRSKTSRYGHFRAPDPLMANQFHDKNGPIRPAMRNDMSTVLRPEMTTTTADFARHLFQARRRPSRVGLGSTTVRL